MLALYPGRPVHRDLLVEALWPEIDPGPATRNLQVAVSSVRRVLESAAPGMGSGLLARESNAYVLAFPEGAEVDLWTLEAGLQAGRAALGRTDMEGGVSGLRRALDAYTGELLPEDGLAEWVLGERERRRMEAAEAAQLLAELLLLRGDNPAAAVASERGLRIDRFRDGLWRALVAAYRADGNDAAAARAGRSYREVLAELGVEPNETTL